jgi:ribonuclease HI
VPRRLKIFFDGGYRGDPPSMEVAVVAAGRTAILRDLGPGTSADAEWLALIHALTVARSIGAEDVVLIGDAADVIAKANGRLPCRGEAARHLERFRALAASGTPPRIRQVKRAQNLAGIALARLHPR